MKWRYPPFLTSLAFVTFNLLNLFGSGNIHKVFLSEFIPPWLALSALVLLIYFVMRLLVKDRARVELLTFILVVLLTSYGHVQDSLAEVVIGRPVHAVLLPLWALIFALSVYSILNRKGNFDRVLQAIRASTVILLVMGLAGVVGPLLGGPPRGNVDLDPPAPAEIAAQATVGDHPPDIYYIILDGYTRADILEEYYGYDDSAFIDALTERGFYVAEESRSNYLMTFLSLASSLNMQHITFLSEEINPRSFGVLVPFHMVRDNKVLHTLDALGYTTIHLSSGWEGTKYNPQADVNYRHLGISEHTFNALVLRSSILNPFYRSIFDNEGRNRTLYNFDRLAEIPQRPEPTFTFAHLLVPHVPYVFAADGSPADLAPGEDGYVGQVTYTNTLVLDLVDTILAESEVPPVIILQADHGTLSTGFLEAGQVTDAMLRERSAIFNAYYLPGGDDQLYPDITPVNTFRVVFNTTFGTQLPLLEDTTYVSTYTYPYAFSAMDDPGS